MEAEHAISPGQPRRVIPKPATIVAAVIVAVVLYYFDVHIPLVAPAQARNPSLLYIAGTAGLLSAMLLAGRGYVTRNKLLLGVGLVTGAWLWLDTLMILPTNPYECEVYLKAVRPSLFEGGGN